MRKKQTPSRKKPRRKGRPVTPPAQRKTLLSENERIEFRVMRDRKEKYEAQAELDEKETLSDWFRWLADQRCGLT